VFGDGLEWIAAHRDQPFFVFLHTYQVHFPYVPPAPYDTAFEPAALMPTQNDRQLLRYEQETRCVDDVLGVFLEGLAALGLRQRTLVIVTSDHGEEFQEHGGEQHLFHVYDEVARVPLVMRLPGMFPAGARVGTPVSIVDVAPTVLDVVGLAPLAGADGRSLLPLVLEGPARFAREAVFAESLSSWAAQAIDVVAVRRGDLSCIVRLDAGTECFDRTVDPGEESPLVFPPGDRRQDEVRQIVSRFVQEGQAAAGGTPAVGIPDAERLEKLRALGYLE
jgi:arylsulfatase A-like enzyme